MFDTCCEQGSCWEPEGRQSRVLLDISLKPSAAEVQEAHQTFGSGSSVQSFVYLRLCSSSSCLQCCCYQLALTLRSASLKRGDAQMEPVMECAQTLRPSLPGSS